MKEKTLYVCEKCNTEFSSESEMFFEEMHDIQIAILRSIHSLNDAERFLCDALAMQKNVDDESLYVDKFRDLIGAVRTIKDALFRKCEDISKILKKDET